MTYGIVLLSLCYLLFNLILTTAVASGNRGTVGARIGIVVAFVLFGLPITLISALIIIPREVLKHDNKQ